MEYVYFFLLLAFLIGLLVFLSRLDTRTKNRHRKDAYHLLEQPDPSAKDIKRVLKGLRLYGGRWRRDKEFRQLIDRLEERLKNARE
jgi:hypothetical protein